MNNLMSKCYAIARINKSTIYLWMRTKVNTDRMLLLPSPCVTSIVLTLTVASLPCEKVDNRSFES